MDEAASTGQRRLTTVIARNLARMRSGRALLGNLARSLVVALTAAVVALPLAAIWGVAHARVQDYLGPHQVTFASNFTGEVRIDLGPIGNAYLESPAGPLGLTLTVGAVGSATGPLQLDDLFSSQTLAAYTALYSDPQEIIGAILERLGQDALGQTLLAEVVLLVAFGLWRLRGQLLAPWVARPLTTRRMLAAYATALALVAGSILAPESPNGIRIPVDAARSRFGVVQVDNVLLADLLDRGIKGVTLLADRQQQAVADYVKTATDHLAAALPGKLEPRAGETLLIGFSDLHCNQAMTELITELVARTRPRLVVSSGDDTVNGTAVERGCIRREAAIGGGSVPMGVSSGNHDSDVTEAQQKSAGMTVLDGAVVSAGGLAVLGDDDPEHNVPFSVERTLDRPETEPQLGQRMIDVARTRRVDVITLHQPAATVVIRDSPDPPARLILYGHFHAQAGPQVIWHGDGSWSVGMQEGTAGGVRQPTITQFSTPFSPPLISADVYGYFRDDATGLITGVQPVHFRPDGSVTIENRIATGDLAALPEQTRVKLGAPPTPSVTPSESTGGEPTPGDATPTG